MRAFRDKAVNAFLESKDEYIFPVNAFGSAIYSSELTASYNVLESPTPPSTAIVSGSGNDGDVEDSNRNRPASNVDPVAPTIPPATSPSATPQPLVVPAVDVSDMLPPSRPTLTEMLNNAVDGILSKKY